VYKQVQSKPHKAQEALTAAVTTNKHNLKQHQKCIKYVSLRGDGPCSRMAKDASGDMRLSDPDSDLQ